MSKKKRRAHERRADLQDVYTLSRYPTVHLVLLIEMSAKHLGRLIYCMLNLDSNAAAGLRLLYKLNNKLIKTASIQKIIYIRTSKFL